MDQPSFVVGFALAALSSGASGVRIEGLANIAAVRAATPAPIIGLIKRDFSQFPVRITPLIEDVENIAAAGADIIAFDATSRARPVTAAALCLAVKHTGRTAMADVSTLAEARVAIGFGAVLIGTTLSGYTGGPEPDEPDIGLVAAVAGLGHPVIAEGRIRMPGQAAAAISAGACAVVVGSAITRPEHITSWFSQAISAAQANPAAVRAGRA